MLPVEILNGNMQFILGEHSMTSLGMILTLGERICFITSLNMKAKITHNVVNHLIICIKPSEEPKQAAEILSMANQAPNIKKLHNQLSRPAAENLWKFLMSSKKLKRAGVLRKDIRQIAQNCMARQDNKPPDLPPIAAIDKTEYFNHTGAISMLELNGKAFLLAIDAFARLSQVKMTNTKKPQVALSAFLQMWGIFGYPERACADNGGEFAGFLFAAALEPIGAIVESSPACSPHCSGIVERHSGAIKNLI